MDEELDIHRKLLQLFHEYAKIDIKYQINPTFRSGRKTRRILREIKKLCGIRVQELIDAGTPPKMQERIDKNWGKGRNNWLVAKAKAKAEAKMAEGLPEEPIKEPEKKFGTGQNSWLTAVAKERAKLKEEAKLNPQLLDEIENSINEKGRGAWVKKESEVNAIRPTTKQDSNLLDEDQTQE